MLESRPSHSPGLAFGYALIVGLILVDAGLLLLLIGGPVTILSFIWGLLLLASLPVIAVVGFWTANLTAARYHVADGALLIEWGRIRQVVPLTEIRSLVMGRDLVAEGTAVSRFRGFRWPGFFMGRGRVQEKEAVFYATRPLPEQMLAVTDTAVFGISPIDLENFTDCLEALRVAELTGDEEAPPSRLGFLTWWVWQDRAAQVLLATAVLLNALLFAYLAAIYGRLPAQVPLHFDQFGTVDRLASPGNLFILPLIGLITWNVNGAIGWRFYQQNQHIPAYLLWGTAVIVQLATWAAILNLLS